MAKKKQGKEPKPTKASCDERNRLEKREKKLRKALKGMHRFVAVLETRAEGSHMRAFEVVATYNMYNQLPVGRMLNLTDLDDLILKGVNVDCIKPKTPAGE